MPWRARSCGTGNATPRRWPWSSSAPCSTVRSSTPDIVVTGAVDEATKWAILRGAVALVSPSAFESFGLVLLEAWQAGTPVLVNGASDATRELCERSGGGLWFRTDAEFEVALRRIVEAPELRASFAQAGARYVATKLTWPVIVRRYRTFLDSLASSR